jgi:hypothetical protein
VNKTCPLLLSILNLLLGAFLIIPFDQKNSIVYAQQLDTNDTEILISNVANSSKANASEGAATKANATEGAATKANATEDAATKANATEDAATKANATEDAATKANLIKTASDKELKYCYKSQFGSLGTEEGQFNRPHDIVFDSNGFLYINDRELNIFQKFSPDGKFISQFGEKGEDLGEYRSPYSMVMDSNDKIYVLDRGNDRVVKVGIDGTPIGTWYYYDGKMITDNDDIPEPEKKDKKDKKIVSSKFSNPEAMAIDKSGNFYLTETGNDRIIKFDKNLNMFHNLAKKAKDQANSTILTE